MNQPPRDYLPPELDQARLERQWAAVHSGLDAAARRGLGRAWRSRAVMALAVTAALVIGYRVALRAPVAPSLPNGALVGSATEPVQVVLDDGSRVKLDARSQLRVERAGPAEVQLALLEGGASFDVKAQRARRFRVVVDAVQVEVIGTRFRVARSHDADGASVRVSVQHGVVQVGRVDRAEGVRRLLAGESWSVTLAPRSLDAPSPMPGAPEAPVEPGVDTVRAEPVAPETAPSSGVRERGPREAPAQGVPAAATASDLFAEANLARRAGRVAEAAAAYATLLRQHPEDERAGLSAFELGRLRMDALDDPRGAIDALQRAVASPSSAAFREDAMARLVLAFDALRDQAACRRAREQYLSRYPGGVHALALSARCAAE